MGCSSGCVADPGCPECSERLGEATASELRSLELPPTDSLLDLPGLAELPNQRLKEVVRLLGGEVIIEEVESVDNYRAWIAFRWRKLSVKEARKLCRERGLVAETEEALITKEEYWRWFCSRARRREREPSYPSSSSVTSIGTEDMYDFPLDPFGGVLYFESEGACHAPSRNNVEICFSCASKAVPEDVPDVALLLLKMRVDINAASAAGGPPPLCLAAKIGDLEVLSVLLSAGFHVNEGDDSGATAINWAALHGQGDAIRLLTAARGDVDMVDASGFSPVWRASLKGHEAAVQVLADADADLDKAGGDACTPACKASTNGHAEVVRILASAGADMNKANSDGASPLFMAAKNGHKLVVQELLRCRAELNLAKNDGASPSFAACQSGHLEVLRLLAASRADLNQKSGNGASPAVAAAYHGHEAVLSELLKRRADVNTAFGGRTPLRWAKARGKDNCAAVLRDAGCSMDP